MSPMNYIKLNDVAQVLEECITDDERETQSNPEPDPIVFDNDEQVLESVDEVPQSRTKNAITRLG